MNAIALPCAIALVGMPGAGKTLCADHLRRRGYQGFRFGQIVVDEVERRGLPRTQDSERIVREDLRALQGREAIARLALPLLRQLLQTSPVIFIDGLYSFSEYQLLRRELDASLLVVAIVSARQRRYRRLGTRSQRPLDAAAAEARDLREITTLEKGGPIAIADHTLLNDSTPAALTDALDCLLRHLGLESRTISPDSGNSDKSRL
ncbi:MAG: AAA family ATPase [Anaerolineaceae bacterium]|nr:AAA family ATPase [Anaerolineaceae bacterium]